MLKDITIRTTYICDKCGRCGEKDTDGPFNHSSLHIRRVGWSPPQRVEGVGGRSRSYDLCRLCTSSMQRATEPDRSLPLAQWSST